MKPIVKYNKKSFMKIKEYVVAALTVASVLGLSFTQTAAADAADAGKKYEANWESLNSRPTPQWFSDAKFGIFIHWGIYAVPGWAPKGQYSEWYWNWISNKSDDNPSWVYHRDNFGKDFSYKDFAPMFKAQLYDPAFWADLFVKSGAKYVVPTSKHHDGFAIWPSAEASRTWGHPWNSMEVGPHRDLLGDLGKACRDRGLRFGFYYSLYEWYNPLWQKDHKRYVDEHMIPQFKDVVTRYSPDIIFSDGEWDMPSKDWKSEELLAWVYNESPCKEEVIVNDRWGRECRHHNGGYYTTEYAAGMDNDAHPWEESRGMANSYGYSRREAAEEYKTSRYFIISLADTVSRGGNLLLDIGPDEYGLIPTIMQQRLLDIGDWLRVNGEAIYGTRCAKRTTEWTDGERPDQKRGQFMVTDSIMDQIGQTPKGDSARKKCFFTRKGHTNYAITTGWPGKTLTIKNIKVDPETEVTMLGVEGKLDYKVDGKTLTITVPQLSVDEVPCLYAYSFRITHSEILPE